MLVHVLAVNHLVTRPSRPGWRVNRSLNHSPSLIKHVHAYSLINPTRNKLCTVHISIYSSSMPSRRTRRRSPSPSPPSDAETRKVLPARSSRGTRIHKLIGEEAEADASFWGQSAWQEDGEDDDYSTEAGIFSYRCIALANRCILALIHCVLWFYRGRGRCGLGFRPRRSSR